MAGAVALADVAQPTAHLRRVPGHIEAGHLRGARRGCQQRGEPYRLVARGGRWYALVWDLEREDLRTFRVDRMDLRSNGPRFTPRQLDDDEVAAHFGRERETTNWPVAGRVLMHDSARAVSRWLPPYQGSVTPVDETSCLVELGSWSHGAMVAWLLLFETDFEVLGPPELQEALADVGRRVARASQQG